MGVLTPLAVRIGSWPWVPKFLPQIVAVDKTLQRATAGRVTVLDVAGLPNAMLTVRGRKTGRPRSTPLLCVPRADGRSYLVAGSNFGASAQPVWVVNLEADPDAELRVKGRTFPVHGRLLTGDERDAAWTEMAAVWPNYRLYEQRTDREIKVFELTPTA